MIDSNLVSKYTKFSHLSMSWILRVSPVFTNLFRSIHGKLHPSSNVFLCTEFQSHQLEGEAQLGVPEIQKIKIITFMEF